MTTLIDIHRHPVKGFTAEAMSSATLKKGAGLAFDRHFAVVSGNKEDQPVAGGWVQPRTFLILTLDPELARFNCVLSKDERCVEITAPDGTSAQATCGETDTFDGVNDLLRAHFDPGPHGEIRLVEQAEDRGNWDFADTEISIINLATLRVISEAIGRDLERERFRGNLYIDGLEPWEEFRWPGCRIQVGDAELDVTRPIQRCAMTSTEPGTGERAIDVPASMVKAFGHQFCGVYARVTRTGQIARDDKVHVAETDVFNPHDNLPERATPPSLWPRFLTSDPAAPDHARYRSPLKNWPLPPAHIGQAFKCHPLSKNGSTARHKIQGYGNPGWLAQQSSVRESLCSGPYGRVK